jgi:hypothetical protein
MSQHFSVPDKNRKEITNNQVGNLFSYEICVNAIFVVYIK